MVVILTCMRRLLGHSALVSLTLNWKFASTRVGDVQCAESSLEKLPLTDI